MNWDGKSGTSPCCSPGKRQVSPFVFYKKELFQDVKGQHSAPILAMRKHNNSLQSPSGMILTEEQCRRIPTQFWFIQLLVIT